MGKFTGKVLSVNISEHKGEKKKAVGEAYVKTGFGLEKDAHGGFWHRQVSLLPMESINKMKDMGVAVDCGDFAENLTIEGIDLFKLPISSRLEIGEAMLEITQIGKECHNKGCSIKKAVGTCVMPVEGVFARVINSGWVRVGDAITLVNE